MYTLRDKVPVISVTILAGKEIYKIIYRPYNAFWRGAVGFDLRSTVKTPQVKILLEVLKLFRGGVTFYDLT